MPVAAAVIEFAGGPHSLGHSHIHSKQGRRGAVQRQGLASDQNLRHHPVFAGVIMHRFLCQMQALYNLQHAY